VGDVPIEKAELSGLPGGDQSVLAGHHAEYSWVHEPTLDRARRGDPPARLRLWTRAA
jgi:hypothetical protein